MSQLQLSTATEYNRHKRIYSTLGRICTALAKTYSPRLLVFGCSTGEEVASMRDLYFPHSEIVGVEINDNASAIARQRFSGDPLTSIIASSGFVGKYSNYFDIAICSSVLCLWPQTQGMKNISKAFPFDLVDQVVGSLSESLRPGSLLSIINSNYHVEECQRLKADFCGLDFFQGPLDRDTVEKFAIDGTTLGSTQAMHHIFLKIGS